MRILHTSDWHLGMSVGTGTLAGDQRFFLEQLYSIIEEEQADILLLAGDVYDSSVSNAEAISVYNEATTRICADMGKKMVVIAGNHDGAERLAACSELLKGAGLYVSGRLPREITPILAGNTAIYPLPFFNREEVIALFPEKSTEITSQEKAMKVVCDHIREEMDPSRFNIVVAHALIVSAELSESDRSARVGQASAVSKDVFEGFDYVALGHIHKPQMIDEHICYSGSPVKYSFGNEEGQQKGVVLIDTESSEIRTIPIQMLHDRKTVRGTYEEIIEREDLSEDYLRLYVSDRYAGLELLSALQQKFPYLLELYGKALEEGDGQTALTVGELQSLDEVDIMKRFCGENGGALPNEEQLSLFKEVLEWCEKEGELS